MMKSFLALAFCLISSAAWYEARVDAGVARATRMQIWSQDGRLITTLRRGQSAAFNCFDDNGDSI
jgi:hypothetical protein